MSHLLAKQNVVLNTDASSQAQVFARIADKAMELGITADPEAIVKGLAAREGQGTTGMMDGIAIPHTKCAAVERPALIVMRFVDEIEWESLDDKPIRMVISLLIPEAEAGTTHIQLLSKVARTLVSPQVRTELLTATSEQHVVDLLGEKVLG